jgi:zinc protease
MTAPADAESSAAETVVTPPPAGTPAREEPPAEAPPAEAPPAEGPPAGAPPAEVPGTAVEARDGQVDRRLVPPLGPVPRVARPASAERTVESGLRVLAVRRPGVPLVEIRLRVPFGGTARTLPPRSVLLGETMLTGTARHTQVELAAALQSLGGDLHVSVDADRLLVGGTVLRGGLASLLRLLAEVLSEATYPAREVAGERDRLIERLSIARSQPAVLVREALRRRMFGDHPYARELPSVEAAAAVSPGQLRRLHAERVVPEGGLLVLVGDLSPTRVLDTAEQALADWRSAGLARRVPPLPAVAPGPAVLVDRAGAVQSSIRLGGTALPRDHPDYAALQLANLVFGGYFSSRLVENIREDKGYTYGPHSRIDHGAAGSTLVVDADVATEVTAPALLEIGYELGRMATTPMAEAELADVKQYAIGTLAMSIATQAGLASTLTALAGVGLGLDWLREHPRRITAVTREEAFAVAQEYLAPARLVTVVLGEAASVAQPLSRLGPVELAVDTP